MSITNIQQLPAAVDLTKPYSYVLNFPVIASNTGSATIDLTIGDKDIWVCAFNVSAYDTSAGIDFSEHFVYQRDKFCLQMNSIDGQKMTEDPIDVYSLNRLGNNMLYKGMVLLARTKYTFILTGQGIPSVQVAAAIKFEIDLTGYLLKQI